MENECELFEKELEYKPEDAGYNSSKIPAIDDHLADLLKREKLVAASYLISRNEKVIACRSMGKIRPSSSNKDLP